MKHQLCMLSIAKKIALFTLFVFTLSACANKDKVAAKNENSLMQTTFKISAKTKLFLAAYQKELKTTKQDQDSFEPSKDLVEQYSLTILNDSQYYVKGFATFDDKINKESLSKLGIKVGSKLGNQTSLHIPLNKFEAFLQTPHVTYFEIAEKAQLKNQ